MEHVRQKIAIKLFILTIQSEELLTLEHKKRSIYGIKKSTIAQR